MASEASFGGNLYLWFSLYYPEGNNSSSSLIAKGVEYWLIKEFLCSDGDEMVSIRLIQDALLTSSCHGNNFFRDDGNLRRKRRRLALPADMVVLWNAPTSNITEHYLQQESESEASSSEPLAYTFWNVSFPVYAWGSANDPRLVEKDVQHLLEQKVWKKELGVPIPGSHVSIEGNEEDFLKLLLPTMLPTIQPEEIAPLLLNGPKKIEQRDAHLLVLIGAMLIVVQTIFSLLLYQYGKNFRALQEEKQALLRESQGVDEMLRCSKGFVEIDLDLVTMDPSEQSSSERPKSKKDVATSPMGKDTNETKEQRKRRRPSDSQQEQKERDSMSSTTDKKLQQQTNIITKNHLRIIPPSRRNNHEASSKKRHSHSSSSSQGTEDRNVIHNKQNHHRRNSDEVVGDKKKRHSHSSSSQEDRNSIHNKQNHRHSTASNHRRLSHKKKGHRTSHSSSSRNKENKKLGHDNDSQATNPLLQRNSNNEGGTTTALGTVEMLFQHISGAAVGPTGQVEKHQHRRRGGVVDDTQAL